MVIAVVALGAREVDEDTMDEPSVQPLGVPPGVWLPVVSGPLCHQLSRYGVHLPSTVLKVSFSLCMYHPVEHGETM